MITKWALSILFAATTALFAQPTAPKPPASTPDQDFKKAVGLFTQGKVSEAVPLFKKVQKAKPTRPDVYYYLGLCDAKVPNYESAIANFTKGISLNVKYTAATFERGNVYLAQKKYEDALRDFSRTVELDPNQVQAWFNRGQCYMAQKNYAGALPDFSKTVELDPNQLQAWFNRGQCYGMLKNDQEAINSYLQLLKLDPQHSYAHYWLGLSYYNLKQKDKAIGELQTFVNLNPTAPEAAWVKQLLTQLATW